jgi:4-aminobutyrate aminotransferase-like enzyme/Ser/Thr protein kinase RdoA (MazF antagonist)
MQEDVRHRPQFTSAEAVRLARELYVIDVTAHELPSERDQNFELRCQSGDRFVLKIANSDALRRILDCQNQAMQRISERIGNAICPTVCETNSGQQVVEVSGPGDTRHDVRLVTWVPGVPLAKVQPHSPELLRSLGHVLGQISTALDGFSHPAAVREFPWDLAHACDVIHDKGAAISDPVGRDLVAHFLASYGEVVSPKLGGLRKSVIHNDANDYNVIVEEQNSVDRQVTGLIDFGDMVFSSTVNELAICLAYVVLDKPDPITAAAEVVAGYHNVFPLNQTEFEVLFPLACMRLCASVSISAYQSRLAPENEYLTITSKPAWAMLEKLQTIHPSAAHDAFRNACQRPIDAEYEAVSKHSVEIGMNAEELLAKRTSLLGRSLSVSYDSPLKIVRGRGQYLYDETGRAYLDCVNNVCHVGHCHPHVVEAASRQMATLNTNTRYLHDSIVRYAERLTSTLPEPLSVCYFVNSGSEANDLALRLARAYTGGTEIIVVDGAYHGNLSSLIDISPYKFDGPGGHGAPPFVHKLIMPDGFRGPYKYDDPDAGRNYAEHVQSELRHLSTPGDDQPRRQVAAFICESLLSCGGQIDLPDGYLREVYDHVRAARGVCIADEVQVGFGRVGSYFWGFETQGVVPGIVTMGKPIGNGHPLGAVVTTPEIADTFANGMEYFNTYGGNPVSCAVGLAVLETMENDGLQAHAAQVGGELKASLKQLMTKHSVIGDVRGLGLFLGVELVRDRSTLEPAAELANQIVERAKDEGILLSTDGPLHNVLKIKPPLPFSLANAERLVMTLDKILSETSAE